MGNRKETSKSQENSNSALPPWNLSSLLAVAYPLGILPKAPGTFGSLAGLPLAYAFQSLGGTVPQYAFGIIGLCLLGFGILSYFIIQKTESYWQTHDDGRIVIDEVLGQAIVSSFFPFDLPHMIAAFVLFRIFDIFKPGLIGLADRRLPGAWGTLLDDVIAGIFALVLMAFLSPFIRNIL